MSHKVAVPKDALRPAARAETEMCMHKSVPPYSFVRHFYCSLPNGHRGDHVAYWMHDPNYEEVGASQPAWTGPWE